MAINIICSALALAALILSACATTGPAPTTTLSPFGPNEAVRASMGTIGVASISAEPKFVVGGHNFSEGLAAGWADQEHLCAHPSDLVDIEGCLLLWPLAPIAGGITAVTNGLSNKDREKLEARISSALYGPQGAKKFRDRLLFHAADDWKKMLLDLGTYDATDPAAAATPTPLTENGVQTVLEVSLLPTVIVDDRYVDAAPYISIRVRARARLIRVSDRQLLWSNGELSADGGGGGLSQLGADDGMVLQSNIDGALDRLAEDIVYRVVGVKAPD